MAALNLTPRLRLAVLPPKASAKTIIFPRPVVALDFIPCEYEVPGVGPCDAQVCGRRAVASSIELQIPVCRTHVEEL